MQALMDRRVLFITNSESGQANGHLATCHALLVDQPDVEVHFASFPRIASAVSDVSQYAASQSPEARPIVFHSLAGPSYKQTFENRGLKMDALLNGPGLAGQSKLIKHLEVFSVVWTGPEYVTIYQDIVRVIEKVDPSLIVFDTFFPPAMDAARNLNRQHVALSANSLLDTFRPNQPSGAMFWKYPALCTTYPYPLPLHLIPANLLYYLRLVKAIFSTKKLRETQKYIASQGIKDPFNIFNIYQKDVPWIVPELPETDYPMVIPPNVTTCGPIYLSLAPVSETDPEMATWLKRAPTVFINLGSHMDYGEAEATEMVGAIEALLRGTDAQVLWKFNKRDSYSDEFLNPLNEDLASTRLIMQSWVKADPASLLETGNIVLFVHHGGANSFHEGIATGVPQIILPLWLDLYDFAVKIEWLGIGIWASHETAPRWTSEEVGRAFLRAVGDGDEAKSMREKAGELASLAQKVPGRLVAARKIVEVLNSTSIPTKA